MFCIFVVNWVNEAATVKLQLRVSSGLSPVTAVVFHQPECATREVNATFLLLEVSALVLLYLTGQVILFPVYIWQKNTGERNDEFIIIIIVHSRLLKKGRKTLKQENKCNISSLCVYLYLYLYYHFIVKEEVKSCNFDIDVCFKSELINLRFPGKITLKYP